MSTTYVASVIADAKRNEWHSLQKAARCQFVIRIIPLLESLPEVGHEEVARITSRCLNHSASISEAIREVRRFLSRWDETEWPFELSNPAGILTGNAMPGQWAINATLDID